MSPTSQVVSESTSALRFHPDFSQSHPDDIILQADDDTCFYYRLPLLAELSSYFRNLPPPAPTDLHNGVGVISLPGLSADGMLLFLRILNSLGSTQSGVMNEEDDVAWDTIVEVALASRKYDVAIIIRLILAELQQGEYTAFERYIICVIGDVKEQFERAARDTLEFNSLSFPPDRVNSLKNSCPGYWEALKDLHLRRASAFDKFITDISELSSSFNDIPDWPDICPECGTDRDPVRLDYLQKYLAVKTPEDVIKVTVKTDSHSDCYTCYLLPDGGIGKAVEEFHKNHSGDSLEQGHL